MPDNRATKIDKTPTPIIGGVSNNVVNDGATVNNLRGAAGAVSFSNVAGARAAAPANARANYTVNEAESESALAEIIARIKEADNILIALSDAPTVDELVSAIGLYLYLDRNEKHATVVYSGATPRSIAYLHPEKIFEENTDTLQDFVISLDKEKADHLRYKLEDQFVKIYITPYRSKVSEKDLIFSHGDFNVDLIIALDVSGNAHLEAELREHSRIFRDATVVSIVAGAPLKFGETEWCSPRASSLAEMITKLLFRMSPESTLDEIEATALLTGVISATDRFSNRRTTAETFQVASRLMEAGGNQQIVSENLSLDGYIQKKTATSTLANKKQKIDTATQEIQDKKAGGSVAGAIGRLEIKRAKKVSEEKRGTAKGAPRPDLSAKKPFAPKIDETSNGNNGTARKGAPVNIGPKREEVKPAKPEPTIEEIKPEPSASKNVKPEPTAVVEPIKAEPVASQPGSAAGSAETFAELNADLSAAASSLVNNAGVEAVSEEKPVVELNDKDSLTPAKLEDDLTKDANMNSYVVPESISSAAPSSVSPASSVAPENFSVPASVPAQSQPEKNLATPEPVNLSANSLSDRPEVVIQPPAGSGDGTSRFGQMLTDALAEPVLPAPMAAPTAPQVASTQMNPAVTTSATSAFNIPATAPALAPAPNAPTAPTMGNVPMGDAFTPGGTEGTNLAPLGADLLPPPPAPPVNFGSTLPNNSPDVVDPNRAVPSLSANPVAPATDIASAMSANAAMPGLGGVPNLDAVPSLNAAPAAPISTTPNGAVSPDQAAFQIPGM